MMSQYILHSHNVPIHLWYFCLHLEALWKVKTGNFTLYMIINKTSGRQFLDIDIQNHAFIGMAK